MRKELQIEVSTNGKYLMRVEKLVQSVLVDVMDF